MPRNIMMSESSQVGEQFNAAHIIYIIFFSSKDMFVSFVVASNQIFSFFFCNTLLNQFKQTIFHSLKYIVGRKTN